MRLGQAASALATVVVALAAARPASPEPNLPPRALTHPQTAPAPPALAPPVEPASRTGRRVVPWASALEPLHVEWGNGPELACDVKLYADDGSVDPEAVAAFVRAVGGGPLAPRTVQLVVKAAYHFGAHRIEVVSAYRPATRRAQQSGPHATGSAVDFRLPGVASRQLASFLRKEPRAGVGVYTNPGTQYVHVDVRTQSFHWLDASPPGKTWRERSLGDPTREDRDAAYTPDADLPPH
jgi:hypothetical protein